MFLTVILALVALSISGIAAFYSIAGLAAIFSAAVIPIIIMGVVLEVGKLASVVWLHQHWKRAPFLIKSYLIPAILVLMLITSMGIFGFLSKAHIEQSINVGDTHVQVQTLDNRISREQSRIKQSQTVLDQLDQAVNVLIKFDRIRGKTGSIATRERQKKERAQLAEIINDAHDKIATFNEDRSILSVQQVKLEAEVGPIKYIAALIYGDEVSRSNLDESVRWMIIVIVSVFDPLAIFLILAASAGYKWHKDDKEDKDETQVLVELEQDLENTSSQLSTLADQLFKTEQALDDALLQVQPTDDNETIDYLKEQIQILEDAAFSAEEIRVELDSRLADADFEDGEMVDVLKDEIESLNEQLDEAKHDAVLACDTADNINEQLDASNKQIVKLHQQLDDLNPNTESAEKLQSYSQELSIAKDLLDSSNDKLSTLNDEITTLVEYKDKFNKLADNLVKSNQKLLKSENENERLKAHNLDKSNQKLLELQNENELLKVDVLNIKTISKKRRAILIEYTQKLDDALREVQSLKQLPEPITEDDVAEQNRLVESYEQSHRLHEKTRESHEQRIRDLTQQLEKNKLSLSTSEREEIESVQTAIARTRNELLLSHAQVVHEKDKEITNLRNKLDMVSRQLT